MTQTDVSAILQNQGELRATIVEGFKRIDDKFEAVSDKFLTQKEYSDRHGVWIREHEDKIDELKTFKDKQAGSTDMLKYGLSGISIVVFALSSWALLTLVNLHETINQSTQEAVKQALSGYNIVVK